MAAASLVAGTLGAIYPPSPISILFPRVAPGPPADPDSPESKAYTLSLEEKLQTLPELKKLREREDAKDWYEIRPYKDFPEERRVNNLTAGALRGPGKLALLPLILVKKDESESIVFLHLGRGLCGHDGIVHGGLLATLLDETLARTVCVLDWHLLESRLIVKPDIAQAIINLPEKVGVTAQLTLNYRAPTMADQVCQLFLLAGVTLNHEITRQFIVIKTRIREVKGRKATVSGTVEDLQGTVLVEASAMFVQPRYAKLLHGAQLRKAMGEPPASKEHEEPVLLADGKDLNPGHLQR